MTTYSRTRDEYLETEVLTAGPVRRVQMLYEAAIDAAGKAKAAQAAGDITTRARQVNRAAAILTELALSLDHEKGGLLSKELVELYDYALRRLIEGSTAKQTAPFAEVEELLRTLLTAWKAIPEQQESIGRLAVSTNDRASDQDVVGLVSAGINQLG